MARSSLSRRSFLVRSLVAGASVGLSGVAAAAASDPQSSGVKGRRELGRTGMKISDVSFGASRLRDDQDVVRHALDRGINYFDTAESYTGGVSETTIGRALAGKRDRVFLTSKVETGATGRRDAFMRALEGSLKRLQTDYVDVYFNHAVNDVERVKNPEWLEFVAVAKRQGKIRFSGMSGHAGRLAPCLEEVIRARSVDVVLVAYNFGQDPAFYQKLLRSFDMVAVQPELPALLGRAKAAGIGVVAMKTLMGGRLNDLRPYERPGSTFAQAAFRWVLSNPHVDALIVSMTSREQIDEYLVASGSAAPRAGDAALLARYYVRNSDTTCRFGCDACQSACPSDVPIADVLRARMYARDYGDVALGRETYQGLARSADACTTCPDLCEKACPHGLAIPGLARSTHAWLGGNA